MGFDARLKLVERLIQEQVAERRRSYRGPVTRIIIRKITIGELEDLKVTLEEMDEPLPEDFPAEDEIRIAIREMVAEIPNVRPKLREFVKSPLDGRKLQFARTLLEWLKVGTDVGPGVVPGLDEPSFLQSIERLEEAQSSLDYKTSMSAIMTRPHERRGL